MSLLEMEKYREDFPLLANRDVIYLDSATATLVPSCVIEAIKEFYETNGTIVKRGAYKLTIEATEKYDKARKQVADLFKCAATEVVFIPNESYGVSSLLYSLPWKKNNRIVTSYLEHHSSYLPMLYLASHFDVKIDHLAHDTEGQIDPDSLNELITSDTKLIALTYSPLLFGTITPLESIMKIAHEQQIPVLIDGTRIVGHLPIDLKVLGCDFFVCHGNVGLLGPMGIGLLYINQDIQVELDPLFLGSGTVRKVTEKEYHLMDIPDKFEPGSSNVANAVGLGTAIQYLTNVGLIKIREYERLLIDKLIEGLRRINKVKLYGPLSSANKIGIISFNIEGLNSHDVAMYLDEAANIAVRSGLLCSHPMLNKFNIPGVVQASLHFYNTEDEITKFLEVVETIAKELA
jgi:cysteine desulfurase/selenocysteine lyase